MKIHYYKTYFNLCISTLLCWLYFPHLLVFLFCKQRNEILSDVKATIEINHLPGIKVNIWGLLYALHTDSYFRSVFYHRIGIVWKTLIGWYRPGNKLFFIPHSVKIEGGIKCYHPFATILNARSIGKNFCVRNSTTIGFKDVALGPTIGDNVTLGVGVIIIGDVHIGDNVIVGAGSVVVKDIPNNVVVAGNPARIIRNI